MPIRQFRSEDLEPLVEIVKATDVFRPEEVEVAQELMEIVAGQPDQKDYVIAVFEDEQGTLRGYYCIGQTPMTESTYDLYWIAVDPRVHGRGIGKQLLRHSEEFIAQHGGKLVVAETSSLPKYEKTRLFYEHNHYTEASRIKDYYARGDALVVYIKYL
ncbi:MAG TPA: GNAT family N-acetyltransferase [Bacteroidota bacterium]|nr:GNAT family N-acetyltransferase [Bacteroidota bacterium]